MPTGVSLILDSCAFLRANPQRYFVSSLWTMLSYRLLATVCARVLPVNDVIGKSPIKIKVKTWREIKFYVEVDEEYSGRYGKTIEKCIWFVDKNDKVCLRIKRALRHNFQEVLDVIDKYEEKAENKLKIDDPYLMSHGWRKVNEYIKIKDKP